MIPESKARSKNRRNLYAKSAKSIKRHAPVLKSERSLSPRIDITNTTATTATTTTTTTTTTESKISFVSSTTSPAVVSRSDTVDINDKKRTDERDVHSDQIMFETAFDLLVEKSGESMKREIITFLKSMEESKSLDEAYVGEITPDIRKHLHKMGHKFKKDELNRLLYDMHKEEKLVLVQCSDNYKRWSLSDGIKVSREIASYEKPESTIFTMTEDSDIGAVMSKTGTRRAVKSDNILDIFIGLHGKSVVGFSVARDYDGYIEYAKKQSITTAELRNKLHDMGFVFTKKDVNELLDRLVLESKLLCDNFKDKNYKTWMLAYV